MPLSFRRNEKDLAAGVLFVLGGAVGLKASSNYAMGSATEMGPGYFPFLVFAALLMVGLTMLVTALTSDGGRLERWAWRPLLAVLAALVMFGLIVDVAGFVISVVLLILVSSLAAWRLTMTQIAALALFLTIFSSLLFVVGLRIPISLWPRFLG